MPPREHEHRDPVTGNVTRWWTDERGITVDDPPSPDPRTLTGLTQAVRERSEAPSQPTNTALAVALANQLASAFNYHRGFDATFEGLSTMLGGYERNYAEDSVTFANGVTMTMEELHAQGYHIDHSPELGDMVMTAPQSPEPPAGGIHTAIDGATYEAHRQRLRQELTRAYYGSDSSQDYQAAVARLQEQPSRVFPADEPVGGPEVQPARPTVWDHLLAD